MLSPKKVKYRKKQKGRCAAAPRAATPVAFGDYGLQAMRAAAG